MPRRSSNARALRRCLSPRLVAKWCSAKLWLGLFASSNDDTACTLAEFGSHGNCGVQGPVDLVPPHDGTAAPAVRILPSETYGNVSAVPFVRFFGRLNEIERPMLNTARLRHRDAAMPAPFGSWRERSPSALTRKHLSRDLNNVCRGQLRGNRRIYLSNGKVRSVIEMRSGAAPCRDFPRPRSSSLAGQQIMVRLRVDRWGSAEYAHAVRNARIACNMRMCYRRFICYRARAIGPY